MWHLHYDNLICHKILKLLISAYYFNLIIRFGLRLIQNNIFIQNSRSLHIIFIYSPISLVQKPPDSHGFTAQRHLSSHSINNPKTKKKTNHSITYSLNNQDKFQTFNQKVSPLTSSNFQSLSFDSPLLLRISRTSASSLLGHFASHPFSHFAIGPAHR